MVTTAPPLVRRKLPVVWKLLALVLLLAAVAVGGGMAWLHHESRAALPQLDGTLSVEGLHAPVEVIRDAQGVPHIRARNLDDLLFAQGYVTAQDRLWQMDILRRFAAGDMAEIQGKKALKSDRRQRILQIRNASARILAAFPERERHFLQAYANGVNAFIQTHPHLPVEFQVLGYRPAPWTPLDSLLVTANLHQYLGTRYTVELSREKVLAKLTPEEGADLYPNRSAHDHPPGEDATAEKRATAGSPLQPQSPYAGTENTESNAAARLAGPQIPGLQINDDNFLAAPIAAFWMPESLVSSPERCDDCVPGSNNWVVSGKHTASGKPLLSNDMHLQHGVPGIWYEAHLTVDPTPRDDLPLDVAGLTLPGLPLVVAGHNQRVAWGFTNLGPDVQDVYIEETNPQGQYRAPDGWHDFDRVDEVIHVHGAPDEHLPVAISRHGPVITGIIPGETRTLALKWTYYDPSAVGLPVYALNTARNWREFRDALKLFGSPSQNVVYADVEGHIGYQACGNIPTRRNPSNLLPVAGNDDAHEWTGYIPFDQLPRVYDPPSGILATANGRIVPEGYPYLLASEWMSPYRTERIYQLLEGGQLHPSDAKFTPADMLAIQTDIYSALDHFVAQQFVIAIDRTRSASARTRAAADVLRALHGRMTADSMAPTLAVLGRETLMRMLLQPKLGDTWEDYEWFSASLALENILTQRPARWLPHQYRDYDEFLADAMETALAENGAPSNLASSSSWLYGKKFPVEIDHPIFGLIPGLRELTGTGVLPQSGDTLTVKQVRRTFGPSGRMTVDFSDLDASTLNIVMGQSGNFGSPHYKDQWTAWYNGTTFKLPFSAASVDASAAHRLTLTPK